ncbi:hypothetical protein OPU71_18270 [Niveibacterium sp. 24ML]|uniref:hypothetical protein n=1 Tax=Niveibacterium sp. 24ML TaxID=2985512 RepID=UPI00226DF047|nr:hypothetical protein [Niveibacterium sp. 24ML]MCX9158072.1 hypothetical protein [Niveibacterium sp. 24ML]
MSAARWLPVGGVVLALIAALWAGLLRLGLLLPSPAGQLPLMHGALFGCGFFGTVISLERAIAYGREAGFAVPLASATGTVIALAGAWELALFIWAGAGIGLVVIAFLQAREIREPYADILTLAASFLPLAAVRVIGGHAAPAALAWIAFLVLTIAAERLELSRVMPRPRWAIALPPVLALALAVAAWLAVSHPLVAQRGMALALIGWVLWLLRFDVIRVTLRRPGQPRFTAVCLLGGYLWLAAGALVLAWSPTPLGPGDAAYDAALHAVFVGFVMSMLFGHAPIILPAITGWRPRVRPQLYLALALLHASLLVRLGGDALGEAALRQIGGGLHALALVAYGVLLAQGGGKRIALSRPPRP